MSGHHPLACILPPDLLDRLARTGDEALRSAALDAMRTRRPLPAGPRGGAPRAAAAAGRAPITFARIGGQPNRTIYDQQHGSGQTPGTVVRAEGQPAVADESVNQAYDGFGDTYDLYWTSSTATRSTARACRC